MLVAMKPSVKSQKKRAALTEGEAESEDKANDDYELNRSDASEDYA